MYRRMRWEEVGKYEGRVFRRRRWVVEEEIGGGEKIGGGKCLGGGECLGGGDGY